MPGDGFCCPRVGRLGCATRQANRKALSLSTRSTRRPAWSTTPTSATGTAWRRTPWRATQVAAFMLSCTHMEGPFRDHESSEIPFGQVLQHRDQGVELRYPATVDRGIRELLPGGTQAKVRLLELFLLSNGQSFVSWPGSGERQAAESTRCIRRMTRTVMERTQRGAAGVDEATKIPSFGALAVVHGCEGTTSTTSWRGPCLCCARGARWPDPRGPGAGRPPPAISRRLLNSRQPPTSRCQCG